jgi:hypothetical protein
VTRANSKIADDTHVFRVVLQDEPAILRDIEVIRQPHSGRSREGYRQRVRLRIRPRIRLLFESERTPPGAIRHELRVVCGHG